MIKALFTVSVALIAGAIDAKAQGVTPGGPIGNSTGIGSGLGAPPGGTAPGYANGTTHPVLPPPPPPGGLPPSGRVEAPRPAPVSPRVQGLPRYPAPLDPNDPTAPGPAK
ncbi:MAG: hypothetical protein JSR91_20740 [Proteobacteria bacterium]|nr:hypothetical protein [Pseudomonadota bacterium]